LHWTRDAHFPQCLGQLSLPCSMGQQNKYQPYGLQQPTGKPKVKFTGWPMGWQPPGPGQLAFKKT